jgi:hypothetical protein
VFAAGPDGYCAPHRRLLSLPVEEEVESPNRTEKIILRRTDVDGLYREWLRGTSIRETERICRVSFNAVRKYFLDFAAATHRGLCACGMADGHHKWNYRTVIVPKKKAA